MFSLAQIKAIHSKVKSGADFPAYIREMIQLGVRQYETYVVDGHTDYLGNHDVKIASPAAFAALDIAQCSNAAQLMADLKAHQQGLTDYPTFCRDCAKSGIEKWIVRMEEMSCTYYDLSGNMILEEAIPQ